MVTIPEALTREGGAGSTPAGAEWLARLPALIDRAVERWGLSLGEPFGVGTAAWTAPGTTPDGIPVVLKLTFPHDEATYEAAALMLWRGHAAVELLAHDEADWALLLRRAHPGTRLLDDASPAHQRLLWSAGLLADLHRAPLTNPDLPVLTTVSATWAEVATARANTFAADLAPYRDVVERGLALLTAFGTPGAMPAPAVVLHGDLNPGNVLLDDPASPRPDTPPSPAAHWLAIDPKPMIGDPAYDLWPMLAQIDDPMLHPDPVTVVTQRLALVAPVVGVPPGRAAQWALARTVESVLWQMNTWPEQRANAVRQLDEARVWAALAG